MELIGNRLQLPILKLPRAVPALPDRKPQDNIPQTRWDRMPLWRGAVRVSSTGTARTLPTTATLTSTDNGRRILLRRARP